MNIHGIDSLLSWMAVLFGLVGIVAVGIVALVVAAWCLIFRRAGYPWALGLITLVPIANFVAVLALAFIKWPIEREVEDLRAALGRHAPPAPPVPAHASPSSCTPYAGAPGRQADIEP